MKIAFIAPYKELIDLLYMTFYEKSTGAITLAEKAGSLLKNMAAYILLV